ncbi:NAD(P)-binding protein [Synechococcus sp. CBW1107]|uniref:NAD(P)-binding protein n=1 Tax=Synechococcus sp. CBW1107 TaxID=2789857 RepID=UPI002AD24785|nr:NAD(P)-binding protein [Synechococcus sp. CBW1107]
MALSPGHGCDPAAPSLAVIGAGVAGCALAARMRRLGWQGPISLWESGRGPGGRASTRRSRHDDLVRLDHGAPLLSISGSPQPTLLAPLLDGGWVEPWSGALAQLDGEGRLIAGGTDPLTQGDLYRGRGGMDQLCRGLLELGGTGLELHSQCLVCDLAPTAHGGWELLDQQQQRLDVADWLVLSGTLLVHPRCQTLLGWPEPPLQPLARTLRDPQLERAAAAIAAIDSSPRCALLVLIQASAAEAWRRLPFRLLSFEAAAERRWGLSRLSIQPLEDGRCAVVAHSSAAVARLHADVIGSRSSVAQLPGVSPSPQREQTLIDTLASALSAVMEPWIAPLVLEGADPQLMRWGAAFPEGFGLASELMLCPQSRIGFCGDFISGPGFGRIEGALRSGEELAEQLLAAMGPASVPAQGQPA